jgi:4-amino-4-deoxy-L-arabinose transferase-like glycosyltransferase
MQVSLISFATLFLCLDIGRALADYDEASYAKVIIDTLHSGNFATLQLFGQPYIDKPPLIFWMTMGSVKIFGANEFAFRIISILASVLCCWLVYLIIKELTDDEVSATIGFFILLFSGSFFQFGRELRLDSGAVAAILAALLVYIKSWRNERLLL